MQYNNNAFIQMPVAKVQLQLQIKCGKGQIKIK